MEDNKNKWKVIDQIILKLVKLPTFSRFTFLVNRVFICFIYVLFLTLKCNEKAFGDKIISQIDRPFVAQTTVLKHHGLRPAAGIVHMN